MLVEFHVIPKAGPEPMTTDIEAKRPLTRSLRCRCPACGEGRLFYRFLRTEPECPACGEDMSHHRADEAPPYFTIVIVGHLVVPIILMIQDETDLSNLTHMRIWPVIAGPVGFHSNSGEIHRNSGSVDAR